MIKIEGMKSDSPFPGVLPIFVWNDVQYIGSEDLARDLIKAYGEDTTVKVVPITTLNSKQEEYLVIGVEALIDIPEEVGIETKIDNLEDQLATLRKEVLELTGLVKGVLNRLP